jgi:hypothetical protein
MKVRDVIKELDETAGIWIARAAAIGSSSIRQSRDWSLCQVSPATILALAR